MFRLGWLTILLLSFVVCAGETPAPVPAPAETQIGPRKTVPQLLEQLRTEDPRQRENAAWQLATLGKAAEPEIRTALAAEKSPLTKLELQWLLKPCKAGDVAWSLRLPNPAIAGYTTVMTFVRDGKLYLYCAALPTMLSCIELDTGRLLWSNPAFEKNQRDSGPAILGAGYKYLLGGVAAETWEIKFPGSKAEPIKQDFKAKLIAVDLKTGKKAWEKPRNPNIQSVNWEGTLINWDMDEKRLYAYDIDAGKETWSLPIGGSAISQLHASGPFCLGSSTELAFAVDMRSGQFVSKRHAMIKMLWVDEKNLLATIANNRLIYADRETWKIHWSFDVPEWKNAHEIANMAASPRKIGDAVIVSAAEALKDGEQKSGEGFFKAGKSILYCLDEATGKLRWRHENVGAVTGFTGDRIFALENMDLEAMQAKKLPDSICLDFKTGEPAKALPRVDADMFRPEYSLVSNGRVYGVKDDALNPPDEDNDKDGNASEQSGKRNPKDPYEGKQVEYLCRDAQTGDVLWSKQMAGHTRALHIGGFLILCTHLGEVTALRIVPGGGK